MPTTTPPSSWAKRFLSNVLWGWLGTATSLLTGLYISPIIIRRLGEQGYGLWILAFAFVDYFNLFDFGFKSATVQMIARAHAKGEEDAVNAAFSTALAYFGCVAFFLLAFSWLGAPGVASFFRVAGPLRQDFILLLRIIALGWSLSFAAIGIVAAAEALQIFRQQHLLNTVVQILRAAGYLWVLFNGASLPAMGLVTTIASLLNVCLLFAALRRAFPALRAHPSLFQPRLWRQMRQFGLHAFLSGLGGFLQNQGPAVLVGRLVSDAAVSYFALPNRILQYAVELITRIGSVTMPNAAAWAATGQREQLRSFAVAVNRYSLGLLLPLPAFLLFYGEPLLSRWVTPAFAAQTAPLLPPFLLATTLGVAAQYNSVSILFGMAQHQAYARLVLAEALLLLLAMALLLPAHGLLAAAWALAVLTLLCRGLGAAWLLCAALETPLAAYLRLVYAKALLLVLPVVAALAWLPPVLPGRSWAELLAAALLTGLFYYTLFAAFALLPEHRRRLLAYVRAGLLP